MRILILCATAAFTLTTCAAPKPLPRPTVAPRVNTTVMQPQVPVSKPVVVQPTGHWTDWPIALGTWSYVEDDRGSIARYGAAGKDAVVMLRCDKSRARLYLSRAANAGGSMTVRTSSASKALPVQLTNNQASGNQATYVASELTIGDPILDAMAFSRGRIAFELAGAQNIAIPVWSEIGRVTQDCRP